MLVKVLAGVLALLQAANYVQCCCGHSCLKPNEQCNEPVRKKKSCCSDEAPKPRSCTHVGSGPNIETFQPADAPVELAPVDATVAAPEPSRKATPLFCSSDPIPIGAAIPVLRL